jgi:DNA-binding transcriptional LysR family regulator
MDETKWAPSAAADFDLCEPGVGMALQRRRRPPVQRLQPRMRTPTNDSAIAAVQAVLRIARLLSYQVAAQVRSGALRAVLEDFGSAPLPVHVVHQEGRRATRKVRAFVDLAVERLRSDPG